MKRLWLSLLFVSYSIPAFARPNPREHYRQIQGRWQNPAEQLEITFNVSDDRVRVEGEACETGTPVLCGWIQQDYHWNSTGLQRDYPEYGAMPVEIVELTETKLVKKETHPIVPNRASVTTEELVDENTLHVVSELWDTANNQLNSSREYLLKRATPTLTQ